MSIDRREFVKGSGGIALAAAVGLNSGTSAEGAENNQILEFGGGPDKLAIRYAFSVSVFFNERVFIQSPRTRGFVPAEGGEVWGPRLQGKVVPYGGADYASNGFHAHYRLQANDGAMIYIQNRGYVRRTDGLQLTQPRRQNKPGEPIDQVVRSVGGNDVPMLFRITPIFDAPIGPHDWLTRTLFVGNGQRYVSPDHTIFTYYEVL